MASLIASKIIKEEKNKYVQINVQVIEGKEEENLKYALQISYNTVFVYFRGGRGDRNLDIHVKMCA